MSSWTIVEVSFQVDILIISPAKLPNTVCLSFSNSWI